MFLQPIAVLASEKLDAVGHLVEQKELFGVPLPHWLYADFTEGGIGVSKPVIYMFAAAALCCLVFIPMARKWKTVPRGLQSLLEPFLVFIRDDIVYQNVHPKKVANQLLPFFWTLFFFVLLMNLLGLTPQSIAATGQISMTAGLAIISMLTISGMGMKEQGVLNYWKHLVPPGLPVFVIPLVFVIEIVGLLAKPFALCIRLFANMTGGHIIIFVLLTFCVGMGLLGEAPQPIGAGGWGVAAISVLGAALFAGFEIIVSLVQAYVFTLLTAIFIGMAVHPEH